VQVRKWAGGVERREARGERREPREGAIANRKFKISDLKGEKGRDLRFTICDSRLRAGRGICDL